ncbi:MAG: hypothetical protein Q8Q91_00945 [Candidatus Daviesbacteria bacterium]|nr:hypothetical protein [Candidatus Daviesbacteria bacterium]
MVSNKKIFWTEHSKIKMRQYGLSAGKLLQVIRKPERKEKGIAPGTTAVMQTRKVYASLKSIQVKKRLIPPGEIWLMYKDIKDIRNIISAWRYPGISKPGESIPIPDDIRRELSGI